MCHACSFWVRSSSRAVCSVDAHNWSWNKFLTWREQIRDRLWQKKLPWPSRSPPPTPFSSGIVQCRFLSIMRSSLSAVQCQPFCRLDGADLLCWCCCSRTDKTLLISVNVIFVQWTHSGYVDGKDQPGSGLEECRGDSRLRGDLVAPSYGVCCCLGEFCDACQPADEQAGGPMAGVLWNWHTEIDRLRLLIMIMIANARAMSLKCAWIAVHLDDADPFWKDESIYAHLLGFIISTFVLNNSSKYSSVYA